MRTDNIDDTDTTGTSPDLPVFKPCVRSGYCCKQATCTAGLVHGAEPRGCKFLKGDRPGNYSCGLVEQKPELKELMAIGAGCCSSLNTDRKLVSHATNIQRSV